MTAARIIPVLTTNASRFLSNESGATDPESFGVWCFAVAAAITVSKSLPKPAELFELVEDAFALRTF
ncbi:MAG: hypothetical protein LBR29_11510 [Methylobacteriaceae bacterium]|nr:hypothetical protein [Methylobacteriaceae bacterium]